MSGRSLLPPPPPPRRVPMVLTSCLPVSTGPIPLPSDVFPLKLSAPSKRHGKRAGNQLALQINVTSCKRRSPKLAAEPSINTVARGASRLTHHSFASLFGPTRTETISQLEYAAPSITSSLFPGSFRSLAHECNLLLFLVFWQYFRFPPPSPDQNNLPYHPISSIPQYELLP